MPKAIQCWAVGEEVCRWCVATGSRSSSLGIKSQLLPLGPSPPGERWGWPESCRQLEVINPAGNASQAAISETLRGRKGSMSPDSVFTFLEWLTWQRNISRRIISPSCAKEKHPRVGITHPTALTCHYHSLSRYLQVSQVIFYLSLLPPMVSPGGFLHPKPGLWGCSLHKKEKGMAKTMNVLSLRYLIRDIQM